MDTFNDTEDRKDWVNKDVYGILRKETEVDSDVNEDSNREQQLDDSFQDWYLNIGYWVQQKENMTQVPKSNVFDDIPELETE
ncbi:hypothetical protein [Paenibacillus sp. XY044]|uniref:hypothetical protein n=1 Tax=Paenibacillus sp. XY044 TaxID=2026089 RepID=UPI00211B2FAF|nr:hypothetical protein [Paenibacillus sp. XY044]